MIGSQYSSFFEFGLISATFFFWTGWMMDREFYILLPTSKRTPFFLTGNKQNNLKSKCSNNTSPENESQNTQS